MPAGERNIFELISIDEPDPAQTQRCTRTFLIRAFGLYAIYIQKKDLEQS